MKPIGLTNEISTYENLFNTLGKWLNCKNGGYLITEYLKGNRELGTIWGNTPNTLRVMVIKEKSKKPAIACSIFQFGSLRTGVLDIPAVGGVCCNVNIDTGEFFDGRILNNNRLEECIYHPDTQAFLNGLLPHWELLKEIIFRISEYLPQLQYLGYDIIFTDESFKIIEINSHQGIKTHQFYQPFFVNEKTKGFFGELIQQKKFLRESKKKNSLFHKSARFVKRWVEKPIKIIANKLGKINPNG